MAKFNRQSRELRARLARLSTQILYWTMNLNLPATCEVSSFVSSSDMSSPNFRQETGDQLLSVCMGCLESTTSSVDRRMPARNVR